MKQNKQLRGKYWRYGAILLIMAVLGILISMPRIMDRMEEGWQYAVTQFWGNESNPRYIRQLITSDMTTSRMIMWETTGQVNNPVVMYKEKNAPDSTTVKVDAISESFSEDRVNRYLYKGELKGLKPNKEYLYKVGADGRMSDWLSLKTGSTEPFSALVFPDSQSLNYLGFHGLISGAYKKFPDSQFFVVTGNLVDNGESAPQWNSWFNSVRNVIDSIPFVPVTGTQEYYSLDWNIRPPRAFAHLFVWPCSENHIMRNPYYSFDYGDIHFVVLDTQFKELPEAFRAGAIQSELSWLKEDLAGSDKKWKVVFMHRDVLTYTTGPSGQMSNQISETGTLFMPVFEEGGVDLVLSGQLHTYRRRGHIQDFKRSESGPYYIVSGMSGDIQAKAPWNGHELDEYVTPYEGIPNYLRLRETPSSLVVEAYLADGTMFDSVALTK